MVMEIDLAPETLDELKELTQQQDRSLAVKEAMDAYIRQEKRLRLIELSEEVEMANNWQALEDAEMKEIQDGS